MRYPRATTGLGTLAGLALTAGPALAQPSPLPTEPVLPLDLAEEAAAAAVAACEADGFPVSAAVVDRGGNLKALLRADGAGAVTPDSSFKKAYTAASVGESTGELARLVVEMPEVAGLNFLNENTLILAGGLPIEIGGELVGGIGVGGAPGGPLDEACARAGLQSIGAGGGDADGEDGGGQ